MKPIICIGVPYWIGEKPTHESPVEILQRSGIHEELGAEWVMVQPDFAAYADPVVAVNQALAETIQAHPDHFPIIFSGDCMSALGTVKGLGVQGVVWYDAHGDFNTPETTPSGFLGGMPLAMLVGRGDLTCAQAIGLEPIPEKNVLLSDARNLDPLEAEALIASEVIHMDKVGKLLTVPLPSVPFYIHLDLDVIDAAIFPALAYPEPNGATLDDIASSLKRVLRDGDCRGLLMTLWDSSLTDDHRVYVDAVRQFAGLVSA